MSLLTCVLFRSAPLAHPAHVGGLGEGAYSFLDTCLPAEHFARALPGCSGSVSPLGDTVTLVTRDAGGSYSPKASVRLPARCLVSPFFVDLRPSAQSIGTEKDDAVSEQRAEHGCPLKEADAARRSRWVKRPTTPCTSEGGAEVHPLSARF